MYHTQEKWEHCLTSPIQCIREDAWLGDGYYFWDDLIDAENWGNSSKRQTGMFEIYSAIINLENCLDTVFNREHYEFWVNQIEKAAAKINELTGIKPTIKEINAYFKEVASWNEVEGIVFQDLPANPSYVKVSKFWYKKRIQVAVFNLEIMSNFEFHSEAVCK